MKRIALKERMDKSTSYEPMSGCWLWSGCVNSENYGVIKVSGKQEKAHRIAWYLSFGEIPVGFEIDHVCHNLLCVNPSHLRLATRQQNAAYRLKPSTNTSGYKGVRKMPSGKWRARIKYAGKVVDIGLYDNAEDAAMAYLVEAKKIFNNFACAG